MFCVAKSPREGSRKAVVCQAFLIDGSTKRAIEAGLPLGLSRATIKTWASEWRRMMDAKPEDLSRAMMSILEKLYKMA